MLEYLKSLVRKKPSDPVWDLELTETRDKGGLAIYEGTPKNPEVMMNILAYAGAKQKIIAWAHDIGSPIKIQIRDAKIPHEFEAMLSNVPNRGPDSDENTDGQALLMGELKAYEKIVIEELQKTRSSLRDMIDAVIRKNPTRKRAFDEYIEGVLQRKCRGDLSLLMLQLAQATARTDVEAILHRETERITNTIPHARHYWEQSKGSLLLVPEGKIVHRREGRKGVQTAWHTDTVTEGVLAFAMPEDASIPKKALLRK